ncbi:MAG: hypothetical protein U0793_20630 [Gemmataceae bacterium]
MLDVILGQYAVARLGATRTCFCGGSQRFDQPCQDPQKHATLATRAATLIYEQIPWSQAPLSRVPAFCYVDGISQGAFGMNSDLRRRLDSVMERLTHLRDSL